VKPQLICRTLTPLREVPTCWTPSEAVVRPDPGMAGPLCLRRGRAGNGDVCEQARNKGSDSNSVQAFDHAAAIRRALSRSRLARPYICRLMSLSLLILPST